MNSESLAFKIWFQSFSLSSWDYCVLRASEAPGQLALPTYSIVHLSVPSPLCTGCIFLPVMPLPLSSLGWLFCGGDSPLARCLEGEKGLGRREMYAGGCIAVTRPSAEPGCAGLRNEGKGGTSTL